MLRNHSGRRYRNTDPARVLVEPLLAEQGVVLDACDGEQWDGQDSVEPDMGATCTPMLRPDPNAIFVAMCQQADPNAAPSHDILNPLALRASTRALNEAYVSYNVALVARGAVYVGTCGAGEQGLEGDASCDGTRELRTGIYFRDNTPGNIIVNLLPECLFSITGCYASESDCSQATYQYGRYHPPSQCGRDNNAVGVGLVLLP